MSIAVRLLVSGIVQGVGFRDFTARAAARLGVMGWVRNLYDERVEVSGGLADGDQVVLAPESTLVDGTRVTPTAQQ